MEGWVPGPAPRPATVMGTDMPPVYEYPRDNGDFTVIGGYVYRGSNYAAQLAGKYIFGDNGSSRIYSLALNSNGPPTVTYLCNLPGGSGYTGLASFGVDRSNELYMVQIGAAGQIYKLTRPI